MPPEAPRNDHLPHPDQSQSYWQTYPHPLTDYRSTADLPSYTDILIVGAGPTGVAIAHHLARSGASDLTITLLDARSVCSGASGRNGGHVRPDLYGHIPKYIARAGIDAGLEVAETEIAGMWTVKKVVEEEGIDCDFRLTRSMDVWCNKEEAARAKEVYDSMVAKGLEYMKDVCFVTGVGAESYSGVKGAKAAASYTAATIHPTKFILHLLSPLVSSGRVNLQTHTRVLSIHRSQGLFTATTPRGTIHANQIIHATNAHVSALLPEYAQSIVPCKGVCSRITHHGGPPMTNSYIHRDEEGVLTYLIPRPDSVIAGGAAQLFRSRKRDWYRNADDSVPIPGVAGYWDGFMQRSFSGWEGSDAKVEEVWAGIMGYSFDTAPHVGRVPGRDGEYIAAGFNGHGMTVIWAVAKGVAALNVADAQRRKDRREEMLRYEDLGLPRVFESTARRIETAQRLREEDGDILGSGAAFRTRDGKAVEVTPNEHI